MGGLTRSVGGGTLTFAYQGFTSTDQAFLQQVESVVYPAIVSLYGAPAVSGTVTVVNAGTIDSGIVTDSQFVSFGVYDVSHNQILLPTYASNESFTQAFIVNILHAFHGPAVFQYDAWEQGFARAAAAVIARQTAGTIGITDPAGNGLIDLLPYYDLLNQPSLGNSTFIPVSQATLTLDTSGTLLAARLGMSGAAWLKVYIENPDFFRQFNAAYYAQFDPTTNPGLAGDVPSLRALAQPLLPAGVEGIDWNDWYQQQFILNTAYSAGEQLFVFEVPGSYDPSNASAGQATGLTLTYYIGQKNGDETLPSSVTAYATYLDSTDARLNLGIASESTIANDSQGSNLTTFVNPTQGTDNGRITANIHVGNASQTVYIVSGFTGDFQAVVLGPNVAGTASVTSTVVSSATTRSASGTLNNGAFGVGTGSDLNDLAVTTIAIANGGATTSYRRNTGDGQYYAVLRNGNTGSGVVTVAHTFTTGDIPSLVTFPVTPLNPIVDQALGLPGSAFVLSYWNVTTGAYETIIPGQPSIAPLTTGRGYWFKLEPNSVSTTTSVSVTGTAPSTDTDFVMTLSYGWNLIGSPYATPIDISNILVQYQQNSDGISFGDAVNNNLVSALPFSWDPGTVAYSTTSTIDGTNWQGYWLRVLVPNGITLLLPAPDATGRAAQVHRAALSRGFHRAPAAAPDWSVRLRATQAVSVVLKNAPALRSANVALGVGRSVKPVGFDNRYDLEAPPAIVSTLSMRFPHKEWGDGKSTGNYVADYRAATLAAAKATWDMEVQTPTAGAVTVTWDGLTKLPKTTRLTLIDGASGVRTALRSRSSYTFSAVAGQTRAFQIVAEPERSMPLRITPMLVQSTGAATSRAVHAAGINVGYMVSGDADVTVQFLSLSGRVVRHLPTTRAEGTLIQSLRWDGKGDGGQALPIGMYRVEIVARADDGTTTHYQQAVMLLQ